MGFGLRPGDAYSREFESSEFRVRTIANIGQICLNDPQYHEGWNVQFFDPVRGPDEASVPQLPMRGGCLLQNGF